MSQSDRKHQPAARQPWSARPRRKGKTAQTLTCLAFLGTIIGSPAVARAQAVYGSIIGTVTDPSGASIPNAQVIITDVAKGISVTVQTNDSGQYSAQHLISDIYSVTVQAPGFARTTRSNVQVFVDTSPKVDVQLKTGEATQTVEVSSSEPLLETDRSDVATVLNARAVEQLPNVNRNFTSFELLTPGTTYIGWNVGQAQNPQQSQQIEVNGQLPFATGYELDGTDNQDPIIGVAVINPNLDAVSELKVTSQNYDAEQGKAVAGLVTAQTKSGSNDFHGSAFEFRRSDAQQARDPFTQFAPDPITGRYIPSFLHNQFGGSLGGPVRREKAFFFGDYQGLRERTGVSVLQTVPTALAHTSCTATATCNLSDYLNGGQGQVYDPTTNLTGTAGRVPFAGNLLPSASLSAPSVALLKALPLPNTGAAGAVVNNYVASGSGGFNTNQADGRVDIQATPKLHLFGRYTFFNSNLNGAPFFGAAGGSGFGSGNFAGTDTALDQSVAGGGDLALNAKWTTDFRFGWFRVHINEEGPDYNQAAGTTLGIPNVNQGDLSLNGGLPQFNIDGLSEYGTSANQFLQTENQFQVVDNWTHVLGNHTIRFGADLRYSLNHLVGLDNNNVRSGNFHFAASATQGPGGLSAGLGLGTFLRGDVTAFQRTQTQNTNAQERQKKVFSFVQDQWRATSKLTLNYGVRWEVYFPETVAGRGQGGLLDFNTGDIRIAGYGPWGTNLNVNNELTHFAPRLGVAYQVHKNTVVRAGYGRVYGQGWSGDTFGEVLTFSFPTQVSQNLNAQTNNASLFNLSQGPPSFAFTPIPASGNYALPDGVSVPTRPLTNRIPTLDAWNAAVEQQLSATSSLRLQYVASHGIHNMFDSSNQASPNQPTLAGYKAINPATGAIYTQSERRPYFDGTAQTLGVPYGASFGWEQDIRYNANEATSSYQALQVVFEKRFSSGFQVLSHYTWSKARAHESDYFFIDHNADYGNSYYNRPQAFIFTGNWDLPFGRDKAIGAHLPRIVNQIVGGFQLNGTATWQSGLPFTPSYQECTNDQDIDGQGGSLCRPSHFGNNYGIQTGAFDPINHTRRYFAQVAPLATNGAVSGGFLRPNVGQFGDIQRDSLYGPRLFNTDVSVAKNFSVTERVRLQLTAQAFNVFNKANLAGPNGCVDCINSNSGLVTDVIGSQDGSSLRRMQFAGRFQF